MRHVPRARSFRSCLFPVLVVALGAGCSAESSTDDAIVSGLTSGATSSVIAMQSDWTTGYCANVTVSNSGTSPTTTWTVVINLNQSTLANLWGANETTSGSSMTTTPLSYNAVIAPGSSVTFGFCGNATGTNYRPTIASVSAAGNGSSSGGTGGTTGTGGTSATGGATGTGGAKATGGTTGAGGVSGTGGTTGTGGSNATGGTSGSPGPAASGSGSTCAQFGNIWMNGNLYYAQNNVWGSTLTQCISINNTVLTVTSANFNNSTSGSPASYPSFVYGCAYGNCTASSGLPKVVSAISSAPSSFSVSSAAGAWDLAYDIWLDPTARTNGQDTGEEIMIWLDSSGAQPAGSQVGSVSIDGQTWEVWFSRMSQWNYVAYRAHGLRSVNIDIKHFINDSVQRGYAQSTWYLTSVQAGFEIWQGGTGLAVNAFAAKVN